MCSRQANQFPSKFSALPDIAGSERGQRVSSPTTATSMGGPNNQLVPYSYSKPRSPSDDGERVQQLETRVNVAEKTNRALLEEMVRLQNELKTTVRQNADALRDERMARQQLESALHNSTDLVNQLSSRVQHAEDKAQQDHLALSSLQTQTRSVEQVVKSHQQENSSRRDMQGAK